MVAPRLRVVTGKGGVGKTVVATALGLAEASRKRRVLVAEVNGRDRVSALLGVKPAGTEIRELLPNFFAVDMTPRASLREYALMMVRFETLYKAVFENRLMQRFLRLLPSLGELMMLGKLWYHEQEFVNDYPRFDLIVVDAPATGHARDLLRAPSVVQRMMPPGPMREIARRLHTMLTDGERSVMHIVTTPEEMPVNEASELAALGAELPLCLGATIVNQRLEPLPEGALDRLARGLPDERLGGVINALRVREEKRLAGEEHLQRLPAPLAATLVSLPRLVEAQFGRAEVEKLATHLTAVVESP